MNPLAETTEIDPDANLVALAQSGSRDALEALVARHQAWIYNIVLRMIYDRHDAEDVTQEILIKLVTKLSTFEGRSRFRTWLYRLVVNHVLNMKRTRAEQWEWTFEKYGSGLRAAPDEELPDPNAVPVDLQLLVEEAKIGCTTGMPLCLSREQRLVYILDEIFGVSDVVAGELLDISRDNFRQKLARARRDLNQFMHGQCGLVNAANPCRCAKKTQAFMRAGYVDPQNLLFAQPHLDRVRDLAPRTYERLEALDASYAEINRGHPFQPGPDFVGAIRRLIGGALAIAIVFVAVSCSKLPDDYSPDAIIALEKGALDRWGKGDPSGYFEIMGNTETYFDPTTEKRVDGLQALREHIAPFTGKIHIDRVDMIDPKVQRVGDLAVLTFNLSDHGASIGEAPKGDTRWNSTEVFQRIDGKWKIVHSHWSYVKPDLKPAVIATLGAAPRAPTDVSSRASGAASSHHS